MHRVKIGICRKDEKRGGRKQLPKYQDLGKEKPRELCTILCLLYNVSSLEQIMFFKSFSMLHPLHLM